jgi:pimeloyl-ACP methyl ester carboxylesterase
VYQRLSSAFRSAAISAMQLAFRNSDKLEEAVHDLRAAISFLRKDQAVHHVGLIGHGFGGAAVINAAVMESDVEVLVTLCSDCANLAALSSLYQPLLLIHGKQDVVGPEPRSMYAHIPGPKELLLVADGHDLSGCEEEIFERTFCWISSVLRSSRRC